MGKDLLILFTIASWCLNPGYYESLGRRVAGCLVDEHNPGKSGKGKYRQTSSRLR